MGRHIKNGVSYGGTVSQASMIMHGDKSVATELNEINSNLRGYIAGTITSGETTITLTDARITADSFVDIYFEDKILAPTNVTVTDGSIVIEIDAQDTDTNVRVRCGQWLG